MNCPVKSKAKGHFRGKLPNNSASGNSGGKGLFSSSFKDNSFSLNLGLVLMIVLPVHVSH